MNTKFYFTQLAKITITTLSLLFLMISFQSAQAAVTPTVTQSSTATVNQGSTNQQIIRVQLQNGGGNPNNTVSSMQFTMINTNNADVTAARIYVTTTTTFSTTTQVGSTITNPTGTITFSSLAYALNGSNTNRYFWLVFDISSSATPCNTVDASVPANGITITGSNAATIPSSTQSPTGNRTITSANPTASITAIPSGAICNGTSVTFTATNTNGGTPSHQWKVNGVNVGTNSSTYTTSTLANNDVVTVVMTSSYSCLSGNPATSNAITVTVKPIPNAVATPSSPSICSGTSPNIALTSTVANTSGTSFSWTTSVSGNISGASAGSGTTINQTLSNADATNGSATYTITPTLNGCTGSAINEIVTVKPIPVATATPSSETICSATATNISLSSNVAGTTFSWTAATSGSITGQSAGSGSTIAQTLTNSSSTAGTVTYTITPTANGCAGNAITVVITVNPSPIVIATPSSQSICSGTSSSIALSSAVTGTTFSWTSVTSSGNISGNSNSNGNNITDTLTNAGTTSETVTYTITPVANSCTGSSANVVVTVNPNLPVSVSIAANPSGTICAGTNVTFTATPTNGGANPAYQWQVNGVNAGTNSASFSTNSLNNGDVVTNILTSNYACPVGNPDTSNVITMSVNPIPDVIATPSSEIICGGNASSIALSSSVIGTTFSWTASASANISGHTNDTGDTIAQTLTNSNTSIGTVTYTITPSANSCVGSSIDVVVTVNPIIVEATISASSTTICAGDNVTFTAVANNGGSNPSYQWQLNGADLSGETNATYSSTTLAMNDAVRVVMTSDAICSNGLVDTSNVIATTVNAIPSTPVVNSNSPICSGNNLNLTASSDGVTYAWAGPNGFNSSSQNPDINNASTSASGTYSVTASANGCTSQANTIDVVVNPLPSANAGSNNAICNGASVNIGAAAVSGNTYSWTSNPGSFTSNASNPSVSPTTTTTYSLIETVTATSCSNTNSVVISVNPVPVANAGNNATLCNGASVQLGAASTAGRTYSWSSSPSGFTSSISNPTVSPTVNTTYTLVETITATGCTNSNSVVVTVNPIPNATAGNNTTICNNGTIVNLGAAAVSGNTYNWVSNPSGFTSTISNPTATPTVTTTYTLTETITATGCSKSNSVVVTVNPLPAVNTGTSSSICLNGSKQLGATSTAGRTYSWTSNPAGFTSTISNPVVSPTVTTTYTLVVTITATGCSNSGSVVVTVNPLPVANAGTTPGTICYGASASIGAAAVSGNTYSWSPSSSLSSSTISNPVASPTSSVTYTLTETITATGCSKSNTVVVGVHQQFTVTPTSNSPICAGDTAKLVANAYRALPTLTNTNDFPIVAGTSNATYSPITISGNPGAMIGAYTVDRVKFNIVHFQVNLLQIWLVAPNGSEVELVDGQLPIPLPASETEITNPTIKNGATNLINYDTPPWGNVYGPYQPYSGLSGSVDGTWYLKIVQPTGPNNGGTLLSWTLTIGANYGMQYAWTSTPAGFTSNIANPIDFPADTLNYNVTVTDSLNGGCTVSESINVIVNPLPNAPTIANGAVCSGQSTVLTATAPAGAVFHWYSSASSVTPFTTAPNYTTPNLTDTISYFVESQYTSTGCKSSSKSEVVVSINPLPNALVADTQEVCQGILVNIGAAAVAGSTYSWVSNPAGFTSASSDPSVTPNDTTIYTLTETITATGCTKSNSTIVQLKSTGHWEGLVSTEWDNPVNWCGNIPTPTTNVTITPNRPFYPVIVNGVDATCKHLLITPGGTVDLTGGSLAIYGHFHPIIPTNYTQTGGDLIFNGSTTQEALAVTVKDVIVNNNAGVDLLGSMTVTGTMQLNNGLVNTDVYEVNVTNTNVSAISDHSLTRYINGNLRRSMDTTGVYDFPIGNDINYELAQLTLNGLQGVSNVLAKFTSTITGGAPNVTVNGTLINTLLNGGIWTMTPDQQPTSGTFDIKLYERGFTNASMSQNAYTVLKRVNNSSAWSHQGVTVGTSQLWSAGTISVPNYSLATFSDFGIGFGNTVLPVTLTTFTATALHLVVSLDWHTDAEYNNDHFDVQRSADGITFETIGKVNGQGTTVDANNYSFIDAQPYDGNNYYRLKQVDFDGTENYSSVRVVELTTDVISNINIYPVPATDKLYINNVDAHSEVLIVDLSGKIISRVNANNTSIILNVGDLTPGIYLINLIENGQTFIRQIAIQ